MDPKKPTTYQAAANRRKTRLAQAVKDSLSPEAVAAMAAFLQGAATKNKDVDRQVHWFAEMLIELVGGADDHNRLCEEVGL